MTIATLCVGEIRRGLKYVAGIGASLCLAGLLALSAQAQDPVAPAEEAVTVFGENSDAVVATIGDEIITERDLLFTAVLMGDALFNFPEENWREVLIDQAIEFRLVANAAAELGLHENLDFIAEMSLVRERFLRDDYVETVIIPGITDEVLQAAYQVAILGLDLPQEAMIRHIMVATEAEANDIILFLTGGADFAEMAFERSLDRGTGELGGLIDQYWAPGELIQEFDDVVFLAEVGAVFPIPVPFDGAWHVIQVDDRRMRPPPAFEELREGILQGLINSAYTEAIQTLRDGAVVEILPIEIVPPADGENPPAEDGAAAAGEGAAAPAVPAVD